MELQRQYRMLGALGFAVIGTAGAIIEITKGRSILLVLLAFGFSFCGGLIAFPRALGSGRPFPYITLTFMILTGLGFAVSTGTSHVTSCATIAAVFVTMARSEEPLREKPGLAEVQEGH